MLGLKSDHHNSPRDIDLQKANKSSQGIYENKTWRSNQEAEDDALDRYQTDMDGSGIDPSLFVNPGNGIRGFDFISSLDGSIWDFVNYQKTYGNKRFGKRHVDYFAGWGMYQETGEPWQCKPKRYNKADPAKGQTEYRQFSAKYMAPSGIGNKALFLPLGIEIRKRISERTGIEVPKRGSFWDWFSSSEEAKEIPLIITEGGKKAAAALQIGLSTTSLFGCTSGREKWDEFAEIKKYKLTEELRILCQGRDTVIAFDQDNKKETIQTVERNISRLAKAIRNAGGNPLVMEWDSKEGKGLDDLIHNEGEERAIDCYKKALPFEVWNIRNLTKLPTPNMRIKARYISDGIDINKIKHELYTHKVLGIKSQYGTGKSVFMNKLIVSVRQDIERIKVVNLTHRNKLGEAMSNAMGIVHGKGTKEERETLEYKLAKIGGISMCFDSFCPESEQRIDLSSEEEINDRFPHGAIIVIDESDQGILHLLDSDTCKTRRISILEQFIRLLRLILTRDNFYLVIADNDLSKRSLNFIENCINTAKIEAFISTDNNKVIQKETEKKGYVKPFLLVNDFRREIERLAVRFPHPEKLLRRMMMGLEKGERQLIHTAAKAEDFKYSTHNIEEHILRRYPQKKVLRIDADTVVDPNHAAFACMGKNENDFNEFLKQFDVVIASPVIETGTSIQTSGHFNVVIGFFQGVQTINSVCQTLERNRDNVPRLIWVAEKMSRPSDAKYKGFSYERLLKYNKEKVALNQTVVNCPALQLVDADNRFLLETWASFKAEIIAMADEYRQNVYRKMREENGYVFIEPENDPTLKKDRMDDGVEDFPSAEEILDEHKLVVEESKEKKRDGVVRAEDLTEEKYNTLYTQRRKTKEESRAIEKYRIKREFGLKKEDELTDDMVKAYINGVTATWKAYYYSTIGKCFSVLANNERVEAVTNKGKAFSIDVNKQSFHIDYQLLEVILRPCLELIDQELMSGDIALLFQEYIINRPGVRQALYNNLNIKIGDSVEQATRSFKCILKRLGYDLICIGRKKGEQRRYKIVVPNDGRDEVLARWYERDCIKYLKNAVA